MKKFLLFSCLLLSICAFSKAQFYERNLVSPAGDYFAAGNVQMTWVLGDLVTGAFDIGQLIVPYGVDVPQSDGVTSEILLFPNPTSGKVFLQLNLEDFENCFCFLYDILGREIHNEKINSHLTELSLASYDNGMYILRVTKENLVQDFKIIKQ